MQSITQAYLNEVEYAKGLENLIEELFSDDPCSGCDYGPRAIKVGNTSHNPECAYSVLHLLKQKHGKSNA